MNEYGILANLDILSETYIPPNIPARDAQIQELRFCLLPAARNEKPINAWLYGKPGTGKTATARYLLGQLKQQTSANGVYVNCWEQNTLFWVLSKILDKLRILHTERRDTSYKLEVLERAIGERSFIIVLDEIDITSPKERNMIIYTLSKIPKAGLVCISESREHYMDLNERVKSRLNPKRIGFKPYSVMDLVHILEQRARLALVPNTWDKTTLERIAELAEGDARVAIQTLKNSAQYAEGDLAERIKPEHIEKGWNEAKKIKKSYILRKLTEDHRILYRIIESRGEVYSGELWRAYLNQCKSIRIKPISMRSFINYVNKLKALGLITAERARRKGKVRVFRPTD